MVRLSELAQGKQGKVYANQMRQAARQPQSLSLLQGRLQQIQRSGSKSQLAKAIKTSKGGTPSIGGRLLSGVGSALSAPLRAVVATAEEFGEAVVGNEDEQSWWENFADPTYGVGRVVERVAPDAPIWVKRAAGFAGDVAFDPLTYLTFGAAPALKAAGRTPGLIRIALEGAQAAAKQGDNVTAKALESLAARAGEKGGARLASEELDQLARLAGQEGKFGYGVSFQVPFTRQGGGLIGKGKYNPAAAYGRTIEKAGSDLVKRGNAGKLGDMIGGQMIEAKRALRSGDPDLTRYGSRVMDAWNMGTARSSGIGRELMLSSRDLEARTVKANLDPDVALEALGQRPVGDTAGGELWNQLMVDGTPDQQAVLQDWGKWFDDLPEGMADVTAVGDARLNWLRDSSETGRPYVPRVLSDEFVEVLRARSKRVKRPKGKLTGEPAWFEKKGYTVGDSVGDDEFARTLVQPGTASDLYPEGVAPSLETQITETLRAQFGDEFVDPFERNLFKSVAKYREGLTEQARNYTVQNFLRDKGISNELITWKVNDKGVRLKPGAKGGLTITQYAGKLDRQLNKADDRLTKQLAKLAELKGLQDEALAAVDETGYRRLQAQVARAEDEVRRQAETIEAAKGRMGQLAEARTARQATYDDWVEVTDEARIMRDEAQGELDTFTRTAFKDSPEHWEQLRQLQANVAEATERHSQFMTADANVGRVTEEVSNNLGVIRELDKIEAEGLAVMEDSPFYDLITDAADRLGVAPDQMGLEQVRTLLRGQADAQMAELHGYAEAFPATADPVEWAREAKNASGRARYWTNKMNTAVDQESFDDAVLQYQGAAKELGFRRELLARVREDQGSPLSALPDAEQVHKQLIDATAAAEATVATPEERALADMSLQAEEWMRNTPDILENPGGGTTWHHGYKAGAPVDAAQDFPLIMKLGKTSSWIDNLWAPSLSANKTFSERWYSAGTVQEILLRANTDRIAVYGPGNPTWQEIAANTEKKIAPGTVVDEYRNMHYADPSYSRTGPGYDFLVNDAVRRLFDENPGMIDRFIQTMEDAASRGKPKYRKGASAWDTPIAVYREARDIQDYARGIGRTLNFDEALEITARRYERGAFPNIPELFEPGNPFMPEPGEYLPGAAKYSRLALDDGLDIEFRETAANAMRDSLARDADVIVFLNGENQDYFGLNIVQAMPTRQWVMEPQVPPTGEAVRTTQQGIEEAKLSYTGKAVDPAKHADLEHQVNQADDVVRAVHEVFEQKDDDLRNAQRAIDSAEQHLAHATAQQGRADTHLANKVEALKEAAEAFKVRAQTTMEPEARVAHLHGKAKQLEAAIEGKGIEWNRMMAERERMETYLRDTLHQGWEGFGFNRQAPSEVKEMLADITRSYDSTTGEGLNKFLRQFDNVNNWMKGWLTSSIGFQTRNTFGGMFNNWLAGVDMVRSPKEWGRIYFATRPQVLKDPARAAQVAVSDQAVSRIMNNAGVTGSGLFHSELGGMTEMSVNPMAGIRTKEKAFVLPYATRKMGEQVVEPWLRGTLAYDRLAKAVRQGRFKDMGISSLDDITAENADAFVRTVSDSPLMSEMVDDVNKYHFNYDDLSRGERQIGRRVIPFYTWTRKNVPLQVEAMFTQPGKAINRYMATKRNIELGTEEEQIVPSYFAEQGFMHLPWQVGGSDLYGTVELPFKDPFKVADVTGQLQGMLNPLIKAPLEVMAGKQFFSDVPLTAEYKEMPLTWMPLIPALKVGAALPFVPWDAPVQSKDGTWMMRDRDAYLVGQYLPFLAQTRRLLPSEPKYENRLWSTALSYMMGVNVRTNTPQDQESEIFRRADALERTVNDLEATGRVPPKPKRERRRSTMDLTTMLATIPSRADTLPTLEESPAEEG